MNNKLLFHEFWRLLAPYRHIFYGSVVCMVVVGISEPLLPLLLGELLDSSQVPASSAVPPSQWLPWAFLVIIIVRSIFGFGRSYLGGWLEVTIQKDLRQQAGYNVLRRAPQKLMTSKSGEITSHIVFLTGGLIKSFIKIITAVVQDSVKLIGYIALLFYLHWQLASIVIVFIMPIFIVTRYINRRIKKRSKGILEKTIMSVSGVNQLVNIWKIIKLYGGQEIEKKHLEKKFSHIRNTMLRRVLAKSALLPLNQILFALPFTYIIYYVIGELERDTITAGSVAAFISTMLLINVPIRSIISSIATWVEMTVTADSVFNFINHPLEKDDGSKTLDKIDGQLSFNQVSFSYRNDTTALDNITLTIKAGETIALVGRSGSGKTTLVNLLPRFLSPDSGSITLDNVNIVDLKLQSLRQHIDIVTQEPLLFEDTMVNNITYPQSMNHDSAKVEAALKNAVVDFIDTLPDKLDTIIGENGATLSGGQRQRLMLARAFYRDAPIIILDEATSALDSDTEGKIKTAMQRLLKGRTAIIIAHRFTTIDFSDRVAVIDKGKLIAIGTVQELLKTCPLFAELYEAQRLEDAAS